MIYMHRQIPVWTPCGRGPDSGLSMCCSKIEPRDLLSSPNNFLQRGQLHESKPRWSSWSWTLLWPHLLRAPSPDKPPGHSPSGEGESVLHPQVRSHWAAPLPLSGFTCGHRFSSAATLPSCRLFGRSWEPVPAPSLAVRGDAQNTSGLLGLLPPDLTLTWFSLSSYFFNLYLLLISNRLNFL